MEVEDILYVHTIVILPFVSKTSKAEQMQCVSLILSY